MPQVDLPGDKLAAVTAALRRVIAEDKHPHAPRLDRLRAALGKLEAAGNTQHAADSPPPPKASPAGKGEKRSRK